ncbi:hypothetical protein H072_844 [Dactylellina haptotyla CBS 200.50]|uniref:NACHT domain-containing protein n=1 Tax=Dactylellina haptotyla (strain CBS 200.50) TaxID=1284197 RepID=S8AQC5_DACHA|nr:hypothetical protein H072_844 [Dactylellina haptotyla CBS 200.50]
MDPLTALGACSSILQVVDFSIKILSKGNELRTSLSGALPENLQLESVASHLQALVAKLQQQNTPSHPQAQGLNQLSALCTQTVNELLSVLETLKITGPRTKWKSFRAAVKSVWKKEKIEELKNRLVTIRDEIEFGIIVDLKEGLVLLSERQSGRFDALDQSTRTVLHAVLAGQSAAAAAAEVQLRVMNNIQSTISTQVASEHQRTRDKILTELRFQRGQMNIPLDDKTDITVMLRSFTTDDRHSAISEAHQKTFEWVWDGLDTAHGGRNNFWSWLKRGKGIYWISGKPGSGKSTLMKYIYHDTRTAEGLKLWSRDTKVITAAFFFWNSGTVMQKSLIGLLQCILYEILQQDDNLKELVFPKDVQNDITKRWMSRSPGTESIWTTNDLQQAFGRLLQVPSLNAYLLIDGLDEYDGDHTDVINILKSLIASPNIKLCVSSRPLANFEHVFAEFPRLRLQDLTHADITLYVRSQLELRPEVARMKLLDPTEFQHLVDSIIAKSSGVFLWVTLAVRSLLDGLNNYDRMADLRYRLTLIPDNLSQLYWHILRSIKPEFYLSQAAKLLRIMHTAITEDLVPAVDLLMYAEDYQDGQPLLDIPMWEAIDYIPAQAKVLEGRLMSRCRGLLEVRDGRVEFLHHSVHEFLSQPEVEKSLDEKISEPFNVYSHLLAAYLTQIKYEWEPGDCNSEPGKKQINVVFRLARKLEEESGTANVNLVGEIDTVLGKRFQNDYLALNHMDPTDPLQALRYDGRAFFRVRSYEDTRLGGGRALFKHFPNFRDEFGGIWSWWDSTSSLSWAGIAAAQGPRPTAWNDTFLSLCLQKGLTRYVSLQLDKGISMNQGPRCRPLLDFVIDPDCLENWITRRGNIISEFIGGRKGSGDILDLCRMLFEKGADPNEEFEGRTIWERVIYLASGGYPYEHSCLIENFKKYDTMGRRFGYTYFRLPYHRIWIDLMKLFLDYGADPNAGLIESFPDVYDPSSDAKIIPVATFVFNNVDNFVSTDRPRAIELHKRILSLGGTQTPYRKPYRTKTNSLLWDLLPTPRPDDIPTLSRTPFDAQNGKLAARPYPAHEGMIAITPTLYDPSPPPPPAEELAVYPSPPHQPYLSPYVPVHEYTPSGYVYEPVPYEPYMRPPTLQLQLDPPCDAYN